jgi:hypothetical protein
MAPYKTLQYIFQKDWKSNITATTEYLELAWSTMGKSLKNLVL